MKVEETTETSQAETTQTETPVATTDEATGTPVEEVSQHQTSDAMASTLAALGGLAGEDVLHEGLKIIKEEEGSEPVGAVEETPKPADPNNPEAVAAEIIKKETKTEEAPEEEGNKNDEVEDIVIESEVFGGKKAVGEKKEDAIAPVTFEGVEEANKYIKEKTGHENLEALVSSSLKSLETSEALQTVTQQVEQFQGVFANLPAELYKAVEMSVQGKDWKSDIMSKPNLDFAQPLENQADKTLVDNYMPGKFSVEEWADYKDEEGDPNLKKAIDIAIGTAKTNYQADRQKIETFQLDSAKEVEARNKIVNASVEASISHLEKSIEGIDPNYVKNLKKNLNINSLQEMFLNKDGSFKEDAALRMVMAESGFSMMNQYRTIAERQTETKERQDILVRTPETPKAKTKGAENKPAVSPDLQKRLELIGSGFESKTVY